MSCAQKKEVTDARVATRLVKTAERLARRDRPRNEPEPENLTGQVCWWCVHPFPVGTLHAIHAPTAYDDRLDRFTTRGNFCSWACAKAWIFDQKSARIWEWQEFLALMRRRATGSFDACWPAPKRELLKIFGGPLTIEEFRTYGGKVEPLQIHWPDEHRMTLTRPQDPRHEPTSFAPSGADDRRKLRAIETATATGDTLKLRRTKPLARTESKLENVLGITRKAK